MKNLMFLDSNIFNNKYTIAGMSNNSLIIADKESNERLLIHRRVLNTISKSEEPVPCIIMERIYKGKINKWLATFFTI